MGFLSDYENTRLSRKQMITVNWQNQALSRFDQWSLSAIGIFHQLTSRPARSGRADRRFFPPLCAGTV